MKFMKTMKVLLERFYSDRVRTYRDYSPTLRSGRSGLEILEVKNEEDSDDDTLPSRLE